MVEDPLTLLLERGADAYGECITQLEHALQSAHQAREAGAGAALVVAALLHDVGHLLRPDDPLRRQTKDLRHEDVGAKLLARWFGPAVTEPVRLHVAAKRYLARDPDYRATLSPASVESLALQGGEMNEAEAAAFMAEAFAQDGLRLRRWDDAAKVIGARTPGLEDFEPMVRAQMRG